MTEFIIVTGITPVNYKNERLPEIKFNSIPIRLYKMLSWHKLIFKILFKEHGAIKCIDLTYIHTFSPYS
jgi:hypothetical protein